MKEGPGLYLGLGTELAGSIIGCMLLGWWLDGELDTSPWLLLVGTLLGLGWGFYALLKAVWDLGDKGSGTETPVGQGIRSRSARTGNFHGKTFY